MMNELLNTAEEKMQINFLNLDRVDVSWKKYLQQALAKMDPLYLHELSITPHWLPGPEKIFSAFSLPLSKVNYVLFGESPYPRAESANGYAFWDAAVHELWSPSGLSKRVNRATSLRNIVKMLLVAENLLSKNNTDQLAIAQINKQSLIQTNDQLFSNLIKHGFLLLNTTPVLRKNTPPQKEARAWRPFMQEILKVLLEKRPEATFILFGLISKIIKSLGEIPAKQLFWAEHPYNHSFIINEEVLNFFKPLHLLRK